MHLYLDSDIDELRMHGHLYEDSDGPQPELYDHWTRVSVCGVND